MQRTIKKLFLSIALLIIAAVIISIFIPRETFPSPDTRIVLDHTYKTYIAPGCFEVSEASNFLEESTLQKAQSLEYKPHPSCTEDALQAEKDTLFKSILKEVGILKKKWDNW